MWDGQYGFFDYKYNIVEYHGQDYDGLGRPVYMIFSIVSILILCFLLHRLKKTTVEKIIKVIAICLPILEIAKVTWESYYDITTGRGFNFEGLLPIYTCSLFMYCMLISAFAKGKLKDCALSWVATIGFVGGMSNVIFIRGLNWYPFFTFGGMYSMVFHYLMVFTSTLIVVTKFKEFKWFDVIQSFGVHIVFSIPVIILNIIFDWDYMQYNYAGGVPIIEDVSTKLAKVGLRPLTAPIMLVVYFALIVFLVSVYMLYQKITKYKND